MLNKLNQKGLAEIVQVLLITVLSILAIATVSSYVLKISKIEQLSPAVDCLTLKSDVTRACLNSNNQVELLVNSVESDLKLKLNINNDLFECSTDYSCSTCNLEQGKKKIFLEELNQYNIGDQISYQFNGCQVQQKTLTACVEP